MEIAVYLEKRQYRQNQCKYCCIMSGYQNKDINFIKLSLLVIALRKTETEENIDSINRFSTSVFIQPNK